MNTVKNDRGNLGFTLVELIIATFIATVLMLIMAQSFHSQSDAYHEQDMVVPRDENLRAAMYILTKDIRMIGYDFAECNCSSITTADANTLSFSTDVDANGSIDAGESYSYFVTDTDGDGIGDSLFGKTSLAGIPLARKISSLSFTYFDSTGTELSNVPLSSTDRDNIRSVTIVLTGITNNGKTKTLTSTVFPRNLGL